MIVAIMQPTYLPWTGYFELMAQSRAFLLFDDVQFVRKSWQHRNRITGPHGEIMLTVPVRTAGRRFQQIKDAEIDARQPWLDEAPSLDSARLRQHRTPTATFRRCAISMRSRGKKLADLNYAFIDFVRRSLGARTTLCLASSLPCRMERNERIIDLCRAVNGDCLYDAAGARRRYRRGHD